MMLKNCGPDLNQYYKKAWLKTFLKKLLVQGTLTPGSPLTSEKK